MPGALSRPMNASTNVLSESETHSTIRLRGLVVKLALDARLVPVNDETFFRVRIDHDVTRADIVMQDLRRNPSVMMDYHIPHEFTIADLSRAHVPTMTLETILTKWEKSSKASIGRPISAVTIR